MPTNSTSGSRTTVSLGRTASLALPSCSSETLWSKARARAGAPWDAAFTWTTQVSPSCESCPSAPTTKWPKNLSSSNQNAGTQTRWWHSSHDRNHWSVFLQGKKDRTKTLPKRLLREDDVVRWVKVKSSSFRHFSGNECLIIASATLSQGTGRWLWGGEKVKKSTKGPLLVAKFPIILLAVLAPALRDCILRSESCAFNL